ncbi:MAG: 30S ribosomal protein S13, partial [Lentisphaerae bacterium]|nr:30S ribosomal protein S13 [Lentisphaerota bacterium]
MPRILGIDIPNNKHTNISLTYLYGIGQKSADEICRRAQ